MKKRPTNKNIIKLTTICYIAVVASVLFVINACNKGGKNDAAQPISSRANTNGNMMTVAAVRMAADGKSASVFFNQHEQIFTVKNSADIAMLQNALKTATPVKVITDATIGAVMQVNKPSATDFSNYNAAMQPLVTNQGVAHRMTASDFLNPNFDAAGALGIASDLDSCTNMVPDLATAQLMFTYLAHQSCSLSGPHEVSPCISFQYVIDGCYARAHKMCWAINNRYHYCTRKVFSFAIDSTDVLGVKADKWGGCCVTWWYHVAPLLVVRTPAGPKAYVIDPGMFDQPVPLSSWIKAQCNKSCAYGANVSMYTIQPTSAYWPADGSGTSFGTDPDYTSTDETLTDYSHLTTCGGGF